jgi:hypothetical protein
MSPASFGKLFSSARSSAFIRIASSALLLGRCGTRLGLLDALVQPCQLFDVALDVLRVDLGAWPGWVRRLRGRCV